MGLLKTLAKLGGIVAVLVGIVFTLAGAYGLAGGTGITFTINERVVGAQEGGLIFSIIGIIVLLGGMAMTYIGDLWSISELWSTILSMVLRFRKSKRVEKVKLGLLVFSTAFLAVYAAYSDIFYSFKSTPLLWFFVIMIPFTLVTATTIMFDYILQKIVF